MFKSFLFIVHARMLTQRPQLWLDTCGGGFTILDHGLLGQIFIVLEYVGNNPIVYFNIILATPNFGARLNNVMI